MIKGHCTISSELASLRHSRLHRSLYNLVYTPNDELNYFILYMESYSLSSYLKFILDVHAFEKVVRQNLSGNSNQQTAALTLFHRYLSLDAKYFIPVDDEIRRTTLCKFNSLFHFVIFHFILLALICPSSNSAIPDPDCFRMAREYAWEFIEQKF